jgi:hypothetical protein
MAQEHAFTPYRVFPSSSYHPRSPHHLQQLYTLPIYLSRPHNSTTMSKGTQISQGIPLGIDPEVLSKINALFSEPDMTRQPRRPTLARRDSTGSSEAWWKSKPETVIPSDHIGTAVPSSDPEDDPDEAEFSEKDSLLPTEQAPDSADHPATSSQAVDPHTPKIVARYIYPSEHRSNHQPLSTVGTPSPDHWPTVASLINTLVGRIYSFIFDDDTPAIIEYSKEEVKQKTDRIQIEVRLVEVNTLQSHHEPAHGSPRPEKLIGIMALVPSANGSHYHTVSITAKSKRVRQILREEQIGSLVEDVYGAQIKAAMRGLGSKA